MHVIDAILFKVWLVGVIEGAVVVSLLWLIVLLIWSSFRRK